LETVKFIALLFIGTGAGFIQRVSGFGIGVFSMLFLPGLLHSPASASTVATLFSCGTCTYNGIKYVKKVEYKTLLCLILGSLIMTPIGVRLAVITPVAIFERVLGIILICLSIYFLFFNNRIKVKANMPTGVLIGGISGGMNGLIAIGGPPIVLYLSNALRDNDVYFATSQLFFAFINIYAITMRAINGIVTKDILLCALIGFIGCLIGDMIGKRVFDKLNPTRLRQIIYIGMIISGILMIV